VKIAVSGGSGFIGRHVTRALNARGMQPVLLCRQTSNLDPSLRHLRVDFDMDRNGGNAYRAAGEPDVLVHLAWGGLPNYMSLHHFETELTRQYRFLRSLIEQGLRHIVVAGTCFEYGMQSGPLREDMDTRPSNPYGFAKDTLRRQLQFLRTEQEFGLTWARLFYVYGPGQSTGSLLPQLARAVANGAPAFPMSGGEQLRDFLPVEEAAGHIVALAAARADAGIINICSGTPTSVRTLVERWLRENGWRIELEFGRYPYPSYEPMAFWGDRTKMDVWLGRLAAV
jgi:nucleoside-diphosphate-sugar epimerase